MPLTDADQAAIATSLRSIADRFAPVIPGAGGTVVTGNFPGRSTPDLSIWQPYFEEDFPFIAQERGEFLTKYSRWGAYPYPWQTTNKRGVYDPNLISVKDLGNGQTAMNCRLIPSNRYTDGKSRSTAAYPRFPGYGWGQHLSLRWEQRCRVVKKVANWHAANLGWPILDSEWPDKGENDYMEMQLDGKLGAYFHVLHGGANGEGQIRFEAPDVDITQWFTVGFELIAGKSYKWLVNGKQVGDTVPAELVPNYPQRVVLQLEDGGGPTEEANVQYDWVACHRLIAA